MPMPPHPPPYTLREVLEAVVADQWRAHEANGQTMLPPENGDAYEVYAYWEVVNELRPGNHDPCPGCTDG